MAEVTLEFLASQQVKLLDEARAMHSEMGQVLFDLASANRIQNWSAAIAKFRFCPPSR